MTKNLLNKYVWLIETIDKARRITFEELNEKWMATGLSEGGKLSVRTFHKWRTDVEDMFGLHIACDCKGGYHYYISEEDEFKAGSIRRWLLDTISVSILLVDNRHIKDRILLENIPSGQKYLSDIIEAMKQGKCISMTYQSFKKNKSCTFDVEPYCVKIFRQRWYLVARSQAYDKILIYGLDRIQHLEILADMQFKMPDTFQPAGYFDEYYGVTVDSQHERSRIKLKVSADQANYFRSLPLHHSQQETERNEAYSIFELYIRPTYDFQQEILRNGENVEVLEPLWLREEMIGMIQRMWNKYNKQDRQV